MTHQYLVHLSHDSCMREVICTLHDLFMSSRAAFARMLPWFASLVRETITIYRLHASFGHDMTHLYLVHLWHDSCVREVICTWHYPFRLHTSFMTHHLHEWGMSHRKRDMSLMNESCHLRMSHVTYEWVLSHIKSSCHIWMFYVTYECVTHQMPHSYVTWLMYTCHDSYEYVTCLIYTWPDSSMSSHVASSWIWGGYD